METVIVVVHVIVAIAIVGLVLLQQGKGADAGAAFGSGASSTVFGAQGSATFLTKITTIIALVFFLTSLSLAYFAANRTPQDTSLIDKEIQTETITSPKLDETKDLP